jgi:hypothetical protein
MKTMDNRTRAKRIAQLLLARLQAAPSPSHVTSIGAAARSSRRNLEGCYVATPSSPPLPAPLRLLG